jgi:hypothetical protein
MQHPLTISSDCNMVINHESPVHGLSRFCHISIILEETQQCSLSDRTVPGPLKHRQDRTAFRGDNLLERRTASTEPRRTVRS